MTLPPIFTTPLTPGALHRQVTARILAEQQARGFSPRETAAYLQRRIPPPRPRRA